MLVGRCFAQATGSDLALVSLSTWIPGNPTEQNHHGVAAKLYAKGITDYDLSAILPTGWNRTIQTVTLTGQQINDLLATGYDAYGNGKGYPYVLVSPVQPEAGKTYQVAICGVSRPAGCRSNGDRQRRSGHGRRKDLLWRIHHHQPGRHRMELNKTDRRYWM